MEKNKGAASPLKMKKFLEADDWVDYLDVEADIQYWVFDEDDPGVVIEEAYRIALRRKSSRERAALKRAGCFFNHGSWWKARKKNPDYYDQFTRSEVLSKLAEGTAKPPKSHPKSPSQLEKTK